MSTLLLRDWLEGLRREGVMVHGWDIPRPEPPSAELPEALSASKAATRALEDALKADVPADAAPRTPEQAGRWLLAGLLDWHRRDAKSQWWEFFRLRGLSDEDLLDESAALAGLEYEGPVGQDKKSIIQRYRFPPDQDTKIDVGDKDWEDRDTRASPGEVVALDQLGGTIDIRRGQTKEAPLRLNLIEPGPFMTKPLPEALAAVADHVLAHGMTGPGPYRAVRDLLQGLPPRISGVPKVRRSDDPTSPSSTRRAASR